MTAAQLKKLKEMAQEVVDLMPCGLMLNGKGNFCRGNDKIVPSIDVLRQIDKVFDHAFELNSVIQNLEGRKAAKKNG